MLKPKLDNPGVFILKTWNKLSRIPIGRLIFSKVLSKLVPYTGSVPFKVISLTEGHCRSELTDHPKIQNHLHSIHAVALMNFAELTSGLAVTTGIPSDARAILVNFQIEFLKKGRGVITAESQIRRIRSLQEEKKLTVKVELMNAKKEVIARAKAGWLIRPKGV